MDVPETRYAKTPDGLSIAYWVLGDGPVDLMYVFGLMGNLEVMWEQPLVTSFFRELASSSRVILHDRRATGLSDRATSLPSLETQVDDMWTVLDAAASHSTVILGVQWGTFAAAMFASPHPDRARSLILFSAHARTRWAPDYPWGVNDELRAHEISIASDAWGTDAHATFVLEFDAPSLIGDRDLVHWYAKMHRHWAAPSAAAAFTEDFYDLDIRHVLPSIRVPALVLARGWKDPGEDAYVAGLIPGASLLRFPGNARQPWIGDRGGIVDAIDDFVGVERARADTDRVLATVLFTDIVGSTERAAELGDREWRELVERHHQSVRELLGRFRGVEVDTAGDGFFATFDGPARAVRCAQRIIEAVKLLGIEVRAGLHTGEVEVDGNSVRGIAVHIGARVGAEAGPSELLVSQTVKDLVAGSGLSFEDAGEHELKGVPDRWRLYRVVS